MSRKKSLGSYVDCESLLDAQFFGEYDCSFLFSKESKSCEVYDARGVETERYRIIIRAKDCKTGRVEWFFRGDIDLRRVHDGENWNHVELGRVYNETVARRFRVAGRNLQGLIEELIKTSAPLPKIDEDSPQPPLIIE